MDTQMMTFVGPTFIMETPTDWIVGSSAQFQAVFRDVIPDGAIHSNLGVAVRTVEEGVKLREVIAIARETQEKEYPDYNVLLEAPVVVGPIGGVRRVFEWQPPDLDTRVQQQQVSLLNGRNLYTLTTTRAAGAENGDEIDAVFEHMLGSFEFRVEPAPEPSGEPPGA